MFNIHNYRKMRKVLFKVMICVALTGMFFAGCADSIKDLYDPNFVIQQYQKNWVDSIGEIDPNQTWNTAKRVAVDIDVEGSSLVNVYTSNPLSSSSKVLAVSNVTGQQLIEFDIPTALNYVYVQAKSNSALNGYYKITNGVATVTRGMATRAEETCGVTVSSETLNLGSFHSFRINGEEAYPGTVSMLEGITTSQSAVWRYLDFVPMFGKEAIFAEGTNNLSLYADQWEVEGDIIYITSEAGPVELTYAFGSTLNKNMIGYFYYEDGAELEDILATDKYICISDARPTSNITFEGLENGFVYDNDMWMGNWLQFNILDDGTFHGGNPYVRGTKYKLTYFDENGNASYNFPAGIHIGFFIVVNGQVLNSEVGDAIYYSMPSLNLETGKCGYVENGYKPFVKTVAYKYGDTMVLGFEDSADDDVNDVVLFIEGDFEQEDDLEQFPEEEYQPTGQEWILACEDLGDTDDFDFNDVVFSVEYISGETTAKITPLAAGGTLPAVIKYNGTTIGQEIHEWFGVNTKTMVNTYGRGTAAESIEISVASDFSMSNKMGGFSIEVNNGTTTVAVAAPATGSAPQMICLADGNWAWPYERVSIVDAYEQFAKWGENSTTYQYWYLTPTGKNVDGDFTNSGNEGPAGGNESGDGGSTGEGGSTGDSEQGGETSEYGIFIASNEQGKNPENKVSADMFSDSGNTLTISVTDDNGCRLYVATSWWTAIVDNVNYPKGIHQIAITPEQVALIKQQGGMIIYMNEAIVEGVWLK